MRDRGRDQTSGSSLMFSGCVLGPRGRGVSVPVFSTVKENTGVVTAKPPTNPALKLADISGDHRPEDCWCEKGRKNCQFGFWFLPSHFCSTKSKMGMDQSGPRRNPAMLSITHSTSSSSSAAIRTAEHRGAPRNLGPDPPAAS